MRAKDKFAGIILLCSMGLSGLCIESGSLDTLPAAMIYFLIGLGIYWMEE